MSDLLTLSIELAGLVIFCIWIVIPIREFRSIALRLKHRPPSVESPPPDHRP